MYELAIWASFTAAILLTIALGVTIALDAGGRWPS